MTVFAPPPPPHEMICDNEVPNSICYSCRTRLTGLTSTPLSPIPHLLGSNAIPTDEQQQSVHEAIELATLDIRRLEEQIRRVESVLGQLKGECQALTKFVDTHHAFRTPARRVYPEIWAEIFKHCPRGSKHRRFSEVEDSFDPDGGPLVLTQVCNAWRQIAIATPQLWTTIRLTYQGYSSSQHCLIRLWIQRSGGLPLTVAVIEHKPANRPKSYPPLNWGEDDALYELCSSSRRWKELYLMLPPSNLPWSAFRSIRHELPSLQKLVVNASRGRISSDLMVDFFEQAPLLRSVTLDYATSFSMIVLPLAQITRLEFNLHKHTPASIDTCLASLALVPNVRECVFHIGSSEPWTMIPEVHHPQLRSLTVVAEPLRDSTQGGLARFFDNLFLPNLESLFVHSVTNGRRWDHYATGRFLSRTPTLQTLELKCDNIKANELLEELREVTALTSLTLSVPTRPTEQLLDHLGSTDPVDLPFLLDLRSISFEALAKPDFVYRIKKMIARRMVLSQHKRTSHLSFVKYDFSSSSSPSGLDCASSGAQTRDSPFDVTRQSASFVFRQRTNPLNFIQTPAITI
ncbi:hypothetical protein Agabi119p4_2212 [Agaricus bisporus var. burnettii]|uniref:F-box domain-containing protein n=1 Tax=Agaricus bisporus var. burnettii TaxID=192524 RepID=A0A8H7KJW5_AGABI|nr:hypothetical protein Agabi119p4_2212 [Agaricus bisporus var. burnettii]